MAQQQLTDFKTTDPGLGNVRFAYNSSNLITGLTISVNDCSGNSRVESISNLNSITFGSTVLNTENGEAYGGWYYYDVNPTVATSSVLDYTGSCSNADLSPAPAIDVFKNSDYNATFNNAIKIRRVQQTGSLSSTQSGIFEVDRKSNYVTPLNLNPIISGSAVTASFQESNLYSKSWILPRYEGSKLTSGSLFYDDPALSFKSFEGAKYDLFESSSTIRSQSASERKLDTFYFNPPYTLGLFGRNINAYHQGSLGLTPPVGQPVYEKEGKEFKRITKSKIYINGTNDIIRLVDSNVLYESNPNNAVTVPSSSNIFTLEVTNIYPDMEAEIRYYYTDELGAGDTGSFQGPGSDIIKVRGTYVASLDAYAVDVPDPTTGLLPFYSPDDTNFEKIQYLIISSSVLP